MELKKETITGTLRKMEKGEKMVFPISKRSYLLNLTSYRLPEQEPNGIWSLASDKVQRTVTVTRKQ